MDKEEATNLVETLVTQNRVVLFSLNYCRFCVKVKELFKELGIEHYVLEVNENVHEKAIREILYEKTHMKTFPSVFINERHVGGCDDTMKFHANGKLFDYLEGNFRNFDYDLIVIGGGSGGISAAKEATKIGMKVALFDFVKPTSHETKWGIGGTCVNVGCIPKKLIHQAAIIGEVLEDSVKFGWKIDETHKSHQSHQHNWKVLVQNIQDYIKSLNFNYVKYFKKNEIKYCNEFAKFKDKHTVESTNCDGNVTERSAQTFVLALGGRPRVPDFPGSQFCITSDDLFSLKEKPGKLLIIGASYIALECAGFLIGVGIDCTVMVRSILLRGFDQHIANMIEAHMESQGVKFLRGYIPVKINLNEDKTLPLMVTYRKTNAVEDKEDTVDNFHTVLLAVGRNANTQGLGLETIGVEINKKNNKIIVDANDRTSCKTVYAIGDVQDGSKELNPVAVKSGILLAQRLNGKGRQMDYSFIPTTLFTPLEYGCVGFSEEEAKVKYSGIECFHNMFQPLEWALSKRNQNRCYAKLVCVSSEDYKVIGFHYLGPNAGEVLQGFTLAVKMGAKKKDFDNLVGIHPVCAEVFTAMYNTERLTKDETSC